MMTEVRKTIGESSASFWSDLEIYNKLNQGQKDIAIKSRCLKKEVTVTTTASTQEYDLKDNSFSDIIDIAEDGVYFKIAGVSYQPLKYRTKKQLNTESPGWQGTAAGTPTYYYYDKSTKTIGLYPKPNSTNAGAYLFISGYYVPKILLAGTASSGTTAQIVFPAGSATLAYPNPINDYYNNLWLEIYSGTGAGQKVEITDYTASSRTALATFATAPDSSSIFGFIPQMPSEAHYLMVYYAIGNLWGKGGSRTKLAFSYLKQYYDGLALFISDFMQTDDEEIVRSSYR